MCWYFHRSHTIDGIVGGGGGGRGFTAHVSHCSTVALVVPFIATLAVKNSKRNDMQTAFTEVEKNVNCTK